MMPSRPSVSRVGSSWLKADRSGKRSPNGKLHSPELLGTCRSKCPYFYQCRPLDNIWAKSSSQPGSRGNPHGGAADISGPGVDDAFFGRLAAVDRDRCVGDGALRWARGSTAAGPAALWLVVLRVGHRLHDDGVGSGDGLRSIGRVAAKSLVRSTLCDTAARHDFGQLYDRCWLGSQYSDDEP